MKSWIRDHPIVASAVGTLVAIWAAGHGRCVAVILVRRALLGSFSGKGNG